MIQLKLRINESNYLLEDIAAVKKYYPNIDDTTFMQLIQLDPTYRDGSNSVGKYGKWILNLFNNGNLSQEDFNVVTPLLNQFRTYRNRVQNKDLNSYKTLDDLTSILADVIDDDSMLSDRQKLRFKKNVKAGRVKVSAEDDYDVVFENEMYIVYVPNTHEASMKLGKGTRWCTAHENPDWYNEYTEDGEKLYIIKDKTTGEKFQFSTQTADLLDQNDKNIDIAQLLNSNKELKKFMFNVMGDKLPDDPYIYDGTKLDSELRRFIENIIIKDGIERIPEFAFFECIGLTSIVIPNSVKYIGDNAFEDCDYTKMVVYTDNNYVKKYCLEKQIMCKPISELKTESVKLSIKEDTCCVPGKIDYMGEDGWSNNVYYFGDKPKKPVSWKELMKKKKTKEVKEMKLSIKEEKIQDNDTHYFYVMAWEYEADKEDRPNYMRKFNVFEEAQEAYTNCIKKFGKESHIILFEYIDGSRKIIKSTQEE
jgi:hypothetical protein